MHTTLSLAEASLNQETPVMECWMDPKEQDKSYIHPTSKKLIFNLRHTRNSYLHKGGVPADYGSFCSVRKFCHTYVFETGP
jgi:hypothetical protein